jgi:hypothetical protein
MSAEAKVSMLFPSSGLKPTEQERIERLDDAVVRAFFDAGVAHRPTWEARSEDGQRLIALRFLVPNSRPVLELDPTEFLSLTDEQLVARVKAALDSSMTSLRSS